ncbi:hypothetical protein DSM104299_02461 [Baekduia alba]|uniref:hypothetical protein n=1 Tax=Baekduia alba TaxID=2997333 RepID=UPI0023421533|nr:hypothetical protein [Baekduia alba]WCB93745.1 hypothetical protein DSM104299_02461 [Baekduia alba]
MKRSAVLIVCVLAALVALAPAAAQAKSKQCGTTTRAFSSSSKFKFKVWVAHGDVSCALAKKVMGRAFTAKAVKGWKCYDATNGPTPVSYSDKCKKGRSEVRGNLLGQVSRTTAQAAYTGKCKTVALTDSIDARVVVVNDTCARGRPLVKRWLAANVRDDRAPRIRKVGGYVCAFGGNTVLVLRCTQRDRVMRASWGD